MTSEERREMRYQRRKAAREAKKDKTPFEQVFSLENLWKSIKKCFRGVGWKASTQRIKVSQLTTLYTLYKKLYNGTYKSRGFCAFTLKERGKTREILATHITERIVQKCLCTYLWKGITPCLVKWNSASQKGRGVKYARDEFKRAFRLRERWVFTFDIHSYFASIRHDEAKRFLARRIGDERILRLCYQFVDEFDGEVGVGLGSEISQVIAIGYLNEIDHEGERRGDYGRYMDDGYFFGERDEVARFRAFVETSLKKKGLALNEKTQAKKTRSGAVFLKRLHKGRDVRFTAKCRQHLLGRVKLLYSLSRERREAAYNSYRALVLETTERRERYAMLWG